MLEAGRADRAPPTPLAAGRPDLPVLERPWRIRAGQTAGRPVEAVRARVLSGRALAVADRRADAVTELLRAEREVADLVAAGYTNRQIASRLVISDRTVEAHVSRILRMLRVPSRAAVGRGLATGS